jgi:hypothetical protein
LSTDTNNLNDLYDTMMPIAPPIRRLHRSKISAESGGQLFFGQMQFVYVSD